MTPKLHMSAEQSYYNARHANRDNATRERQRGTCDVLDAHLPLEHLGRHVPKRRCECEDCVTAVTPVEPQTVSVTLQTTVKPSGMLQHSTACCNIECQVATPRRNRQPRQSLLLSARTLFARRVIASVPRPCCCECSAVLL
jgi:hypothetical protein